MMRFKIWRSVGRQKWRRKLARLAPGIPKESLWAHQSGGIEQVGCVYTAQGFEFDYVGVIFGSDLVFDPKGNCWRGVPERSFDSVVKRSPQTFLSNVKNTYRVLLSRGMKGCYLCFLDENTENFFRSRVEFLVNSTEGAGTVTYSSYFLSDPLNLSTGYFSAFSASFFSAAC